MVVGISAEETNQHSNIENCYVGTIANVKRGQVQVDQNYVTVTSYNHTANTTRLQKNKHVIQECTICVNE